MGPCSRTTRTATIAHMPTFRARDPETGVIQELDITDEQASDLLAGRAVSWFSPEVPDVVVDEDGTLIEREDARPDPKPESPDS